MRKIFVKNVCACVDVLLINLLSLVMYRHAHLKKSRAFVNVIVDIRFESINACVVQKDVARIPLSST